MHGSSCRAGHSEECSQPLPDVFDAHARSEYCHHGEEAVRDEPIAANVVLRLHNAVPQNVAEEAVVVYQIDSQDVWADCHTEAGNARRDIEAAGGEDQEEAYRAQQGQTVPAQAAQQHGLPVCNKSMHLAEVAEAREQQARSYIYRQIAPTGKSVLRHPEFMEIASQAKQRQGENQRHVTAEDVAVAPFSLCEVDDQQYEQKPLVFPLGERVKRPCDEWGKEQNHQVIGHEPVIAAVDGHQLPNGLRPGEVQKSQCTQPCIDGERIEDNHPPQLERLAHGI